MDKKTIISVIIIIVGITALVWWSKGAEKEELSANALTKSHPARTGTMLVASETLYDFGKISMKDGLVSRIFTVTNSSEEDINLEKVTTSCMCTNAYIIGPNGEKKGPYGMPGHGRSVPAANEVIKAGESRDIEVVYDPNAHGPAGVGMIDRFVYLENASGEILQIEIKANVTP